MPKIELIEGSNADQKIFELNLNAAKNTLGSGKIDAFKELLQGKLNFEEKLVERYQQYISDCLDNNLDVPGLIYHTSKKNVYEASNVADASIKRSIHKLHSDIKDITRGTQSVYTDKGNVDLNIPFLEKNINSELISKDYYIIDELAEKRANKNDQQTYLLKTLVNSNQYDRYELDNPMERAIFRRDKNEIVSRVIGLKEYVSEKVIKNAFIELKDIDRKIDNLKNDDLKTSLFSAPINENNDNKIKLLENYKKDFKSTLSFAAVINTIQNKTFTNDNFSKDIENLLKFDFNNNKNSLHLLDSGSISLRAEFATFVNVTEKNKWFAIMDGEDVKNERGDIKTFNNLSTAIEYVFEEKLKKAILSGDINTLEVLLDQSFAKLDSIDPKWISNINDASDKAVVVDLLNEFTSHKAEFKDEKKGAYFQSAFVMSENDRMNDNLKL